MASAAWKVRLKQLGTIEGDEFNSGISAWKRSPNLLVMRISPRPIAPAATGVKEQAISVASTVRLIGLIFEFPDFIQADCAEGAQRGLLNSAQFG